MIFISRKAENCQFEEISAGLKSRCCPGICECREFIARPALLLHTFVVRTCI
jgi:hypothetical protein